MGEGEGEGAPMIYFKSCNRCRGDMHLNSDTYGWFVKCLQCGFQRDLPIGLVPAPIPVLATVPVESDARRRLARAG